MEQLRTVPLKSKIGLKLYGKVAILVENDWENNRFVFQIPTDPNSPVRTAWLMSWSQEDEALKLIAEHTEKVPEKQQTDTVKLISIEPTD